MARRKTCGQKSRERAMECHQQGALRERKCIRIQQNKKGNEKSEHKAITEKRNKKAKNRLRI